MAQRADGLLEPPEATEPWHVAEEFHVTDHVAERALLMLGHAEPDRKAGP